MDFIKTKLTYARDVGAFDASWAELQAKFPSPAWAIDYLLREWISCRQRWAAPFTTKTLTLGSHGSSMAESQNAIISCWLSPTMKLTVSKHCSQRLALTFA